MGSAKHTAYGLASGRDDVSILYMDIPNGGTGGAAEQTAVRSGIDTVDAVVPAVKGAIEGTGNRG